LNVFKSAVVKWFENPFLQTNSVLLPFLMPIAAKSEQSIHSQSEVPFEKSPDLVTSDSLLKKGMLLPLMEEFYTLQGEGFHTGKAAYFIRVGGCDVGCHWCDVKESWNSLLHPLTETDKIAESASRFLAKSVVVTGGEPTLYNLNYLTSKLREKKIKTYLETSGAYTITGEWDWICLSPKKNMPALDTNFAKANELKVIVHNKDDFRFAHENAKKTDGSCHLFLQPEWNKRNEMLPYIIDYIQQNPNWRISLQTHKYIGIP
jgi:7-carboxy-7-deazaguanine synthase